MNLKREIRVNKEILTTLVDDELGLMNVNMGRYYTLNKVGKKIWGLLEEEQTISLLVEKLLLVYDVDKNICMEETIEVLNNMNSQGLIEIVEGR